MASALAFDDADALMLAVSTAGRQIAWVSDDVWRRRRLWDPDPATEAPLPPLHAQSGTGLAPTDLGPDMVEVDGEIALTSPGPVSDDASLPLRLAATAARAGPSHRQGIAPSPGRPHALAR